MNNKKEKIELFGGILIILFGIFSWYIATQPIYKPQHGEEEASIIFQITGIFVVIFGVCLIIKYLKSKKIE